MSGPIIINDDLPCPVCRMSLRGLAVGEGCHGCGLTITWTPRPDQSEALTGITETVAAAPDSASRGMHIDDDLESCLESEEDRADVPGPYPLMPRDDGDRLNGNGALEDDVIARWEALAARCESLLDRVESLLAAQERSNALAG